MAASVWAIHGFLLGGVGCWGGWGEGGLQANRPPSCHKEGLPSLCTAHFPGKAALGTQELGPSGGATWAGPGFSSWQPNGDIPQKGPGLEGVR